MNHRIGPYEVIRELGRGGMGVVSLARDTRLDRNVAIKALPEHVAGDQERLGRFEREAKVVAHLNHPNIAGVYALEEFEGSKYLVMEYVEGETLAARLDRGALPVDEALEIAAQVAAGVEAAHDAGVIHRDLKPGNIIVTPNGQAKVLDFGLARSVESSSTEGQSDLQDSPTITMPAGYSPTMPGVILGTAAYMSPEQARGRHVDKRTDIWSFGVVLYEMLTGASPFAGETVSDSIGAILHKDLDPDRLPRATPSKVRNVLLRCLQRDRRARYRDIGDVRLDLIAPTSPAPEAPDGRNPASTWTVMALGTALLGALVVIGVMLGSKQAAPKPVLRHVAIEPPGDARVLFSGDLAGPPVVSPDGARVAFCAAREGQMRTLWIRDLGEAEPRELDGTERALFPFWSPDGQSIAFFTSDSLMRVDVTSQTVQRICFTGQGRGGAWSEDGQIIFAGGFRGGLSIVNAEGGQPEPLTQLDEKLHTSHRWPWFIPESDRFLFSAVTARAGEADNNGVYMGSLDPKSRPRRVMSCQFGAGYADGFLLYVRDGILLASKFDVKSGAADAHSVVIAHDVAADLSTWHGQFSVSQNGVLVFNRIRDERPNREMAKGYSWSAEGSRVTSFDYTGRMQTTYAEHTPMRTISLSPDGRMLAMDVISKDGFTDIWLHPTAWVPTDPVEPRDPELMRAAILEPEPRRLTFLPGAEVEPVWSPTGDEVAFRWDGDQTRPRGIYRKRVGGGAEVLVRDNTGEDHYPGDWTPDGKYLIVVSGTLLLSEENDVWAVPLDGGDEIPLVVSSAANYSPRVSPDGRWLAYMESLMGSSNVYVIPFAPAWPERTDHRKWLVSDNGGRLPEWSPEGDELFYIADDSLLVSVDVATDNDTFAFSSSRTLFPPPWDVGRTYGVTPKRQNGPNSFVFLDGSEETHAPISIILNWQSRLER